MSDKLENKVNKIYKLYQYLNNGIFSIAVLFWIGAYFAGDAPPVHLGFLMILGEFVFTIILAITCFVAMYLVYIFRKDYKQLKEHFWKIVFIFFPFFALIIGVPVTFALMKKETLLGFFFFAPVLYVYPSIYGSYLIYIIYKKIRLIIAK
ncbi:MAG: hypothetical protein GY793_02955 [Proteobacteria bacterium]|nr:hypothetical protein [Pseudomonadota bacterium]